LNDGGHNLVWGTNDPNNTCGIVAGVNGNINELDGLARMALT
jgi:hypothetical protein